MPLLHLRVLIQVDSAKIVGVDRLGMYVLVTMDGESGKLRLPFMSPAEDRKAVKDRIVEMTRASAPAAAASS
jgi:putative heme iron utilization protein